MKTIRNQNMKLTNKLDSFIRKLNDLEMYFKTTIDDQNKLISNI